MWPILIVAPPPAAITSRGGSRTAAPAARASSGGKPRAAAPRMPSKPDRRTGTYRFAEGYSLRRLNLSHRELLGLVTLKRLGSSLGGTFATAIEETTQKLLRSSDRRTEVSVEHTSLAIRFGEIAMDAEV